MPEISLNRQAVLERGFTPPPEEKVAFYIYNQQKYRADPPESDKGSVLGEYHKERTAWAPELPSDWQPQEPFNKPSPGNRRSGGAQTNSGPGRSTLPSISHFHDGKLHSPDPEFADLENEIMEEGTEIDYDVPDNNHDVKSDEQEMSVGVRTPINKPIRIEAQTPDRMRQPKILLRDSALGLSSPSGSPRVSRHADIQISIQPPTDPTASKSASIAASVKAGTVTQEETQREMNNRQPGSIVSRSRTPVGVTSPRVSSRVVNSQVGGSAAGVARGTTMSQAPSRVPTTRSTVETSVKSPSKLGSKSRAESTIKDHRISRTSTVPPPVPEKDTPRMVPQDRYDPNTEWDDLWRISNHQTARSSKAGSIAQPLPDLGSPKGSTARAPSRGGTERAPSVIPSAKMTDDDQHSLKMRASSPLGHSRDNSGAKPLHPLTSLIHQQRSSSPVPGLNQESIDQLLERAGSPTPSRVSQASRPRSQAPSRAREAVGVGASYAGDATPRAMSPLAAPERPVSRMTEKEALDLLRTPRTTYTVTPSDLAAEVQKSHFHDEDLCVLLHVADDPDVHDVVRKAVRKAVRTRVRKLGFETEAQYRSTYMHKGKHNHKPPGGPPLSMQATAPAPEWAKPLFQLLEDAHSRLDGLDQKIESSRPPTGFSHHESQASSSFVSNPHRILQHHEEMDDVPSVDYEPGADAMQSPATQTRTVPRSNGRDDGVAHTEDFDAEEEDDWGNEEDLHHAGPAHSQLDGTEGIEEELYRLRMKAPSHSEKSQLTWEIEKDDEHVPLSERGRPEESHHHFTESDHPDVASPTTDSTPAFPRPQTNKDQQLWATGAAAGGGAGPNTGDWVEPPLPTWQRVHQRLLNWAIVWSMSEFDHALESTDRARQVDEVALTIWTAQVYKRYVRARSTDNPPQRVDRLFVPPNVADAINSAVYNGRHRDACTMLKDMWSPFGFEGMPRLLIVLARHRRDANHWVVHRFSIPDGTLSTYDTYPDRSLADGRPLGWWFAIRAAWPHPMYPHADLLVQKLVRIHRPLQLQIDNSVAAAAIWRNLIMGSKAERSVDLVRLRDLINTEVRALRTRKDLGKLALPSATIRGGWDEMAA